MFSRKPEVRYLKRLGIGSRNVTAFAWFGFRAVIRVGNLAVFAVLATVATADEEPVPDLEILRSSYIQAVSAIRSIDCRFSQTHIGDPPSDDPDALTMIWSYEVHYVRDGDRRLLSTLGKNPRGKAGIRVWASFDGELYSSWAESLKATAEDGYFAPWGRIAPELPQELSMVQTIDTFLGHQLRGGQMGLDRLILQPETRAVGWDVVEGHRCVRMELPAHTPQGKKPDDLWRTELWLDPGFDYLPRQIHLESTRNAKATRDLLIEEFGRFASGANEREVFLPTTAVWKGGGFERRMVLESAIVNQPSTSDVFRPTFPVGTFVKESVPGRPVRTYAVGSEEIRSQLVRKSTRQTAPKRIIPAGQEPPDARPPAPDASAWFIVLRYGAWTCLIVVVGLIAWRAFRRA